MKVHEIMTTPVLTVRVDASIEQAAELLARHDVNTLPVTDARDRLVGVVTETEVFHALALHLGIGLSPTARLDATTAPRQVADITQEPIARVSRDDDVRLCLALMAKDHGMAIPVMDGQRVVGIVTRGNALQALTRLDRAQLEDHVRQGQIGRAHV